MTAAESDEGIARDGARELHAADWGLCAACRHLRIVRSGRGSMFVLCELAKTDPRFAKYPRLPVTRCVGYEPGIVSGSIPN